MTETVVDLVKRTEERAKQDGTSETSARGDLASLLSKASKQNVAQTEHKYEQKRIVPLEWKKIHDLYHLILTASQSSPSPMTRMEATN